VKEEEEVLQALEQRFPCRLEKTVVRHTVSLQPMEVHKGADIHLQPMEDLTLEQVGAQNKL